MKNYNPYNNLDNIYSVKFLSKVLSDLNIVIPDEKIPEEEFTSKIEQIQDKNNPIILRLKNGCTLLFTFQEYRRLHDKPQIGKNIKYSLQKIPCKNIKNYAYMIKKCIIF